MHLTLNISSCPNDTFMFDALVNGRIDTRGMEFTVTFADIEELNRRVMSAGRDAPDLSKISYAVLSHIADRYTLLDSGSALGHGNGPLLVCREGEGSVFGTTPLAAPLRVAVPGLHTTANLLLQRLFPELTDRRSILFSRIAPSVARGDFDAGVLIHEGRFTYRDHGLELVCDLGEKWASTTGGLPLPLGAIVASRTLPQGVVREVEDLIRKSIEYAFANPEVSKDFVREHAGEMDDEVIANHIRLFVNSNSLTLGPRARLAVSSLTGL